MYGSPALQEHDGVQRDPTCAASRADYTVFASGFWALILGPFAVIRILFSLDERAIGIIGLAAAIIGGIVCLMIAVALLQMFIAPSGDRRANVRRGDPQ